jgi:hypothetical protein
MADASWGRARQAAVVAGLIGLFHAPALAQAPEADTSSSEVQVREGQPIVHEAGAEPPTPSFQSASDSGGPAGPRRSASGSGRAEELSPAPLTRDEWRRTRRSQLKWGFGLATALGVSAAAIGCAIGATITSSRDPDEWFSGPRFGCLAGLGGGLLGWAVGSNVGWYLGTQREGQRLQPTGPVLAGALLGRLVAYTMLASSLAFSQRLDRPGTIALGTSAGVAMATFPLLGGVIGWSAGNRPPSGARAHP